MSIESIENALNEHSPMHVWENLHNIHRHPLRGPETSTRGSVGKADPSNAGIKIATFGDTVFFRVTVADRGGAFFEELEMTRKSLDGLAAALMARLGCA
jgi:hypothetical protein